ncbi:MAG: hypothetical protein IPO65_13085 [Saprospiraceae bacterium]|nr:hypothetical protein [Saprospiraceae bacterium]
MSRKMRFSTTSFLFNLPRVPPSPKVSLAGDGRILTQLIVEQIDGCLFYEGVF